MDFTKRITSGVQRVPDLMVIFGVEGVGKTTFASTAPNPLFADLEGGSKRVETKRVTDFQTIQEFWEFLSWFYETDHGYQTLVIDSLSEFERFAFAETCAQDGVANIEQVGGGYMKGYVIALKQWELLRQAIKRIQTKKQTNVIMIGHADVKTFQDPTTNSAYDRYQLKLDKRSAAFLREWVDFIGFANYLVTTKGNEKAAKQKAYGGERRVMYTERRPAWDAKNRLGLPLMLDFEIGSAYQTYAAAAHADPETKLKLAHAAIEGMLRDVKDPELAKRVRETVAKAGTNLTDLTRVQERLGVKLNEMQEVPSGAAAS